MKDEFTAKMHSVLLAQELKGDDWKIMGVYGAISRGLSKTEALQKYQINEHYYDQNIDRVLNS